MKKAKKKQGLPKRILQGIVKNILVLMETEDGYPAALEVLEQLPEEAQVVLMEDLSGIQEPRLSKFLWLVKEECTGSVKTAAERALARFSMAGLDTKPPVLDRPDFGSGFFTALATPTRFTGRVDLVLAWEKPGDSLDVRYFHLRFGRDGIKEYFRVSEISSTSFSRENSAAEAEFVAISPGEAVHLLRDAYRFNQMFRSRPARGLTQYRSLLEGTPGLSDKQAQRLALRLIEGEHTPEMVVNAFFVALRNFDWGAVYDLLSVRSPLKIPNRETFITQQGHDHGLYTQTTYLKSRIKTLDIDKGMAEVQGYLVIDLKENLYRAEYQLQLEKVAGRWQIRNFQETSRIRIGDNNPDNPLNFDVYCSVYELGNYMDVVALLDALPDIEFVGEFAMGVHYRWLQPANPLSEGVDVTANIFGEFIITDEELIVFSRDEVNVARIAATLSEKLGDGALEHKQCYYLSANLVYAMFGGEYDYFEELLDELGAEISEGPIRAFMATYQVKNAEKVIDRIGSFEVLTLEAPDGTRIFHEFVRVYEDEGTRYGEGFVAEYKLLGETLEITTFDRHQLEVVCREFEKGIKRSIKLLTVEERRDHFAELIPRTFQDLPREMRDRITKIQLERWLKTSMPALNGMTPLQARESIEGCRLLWGLFKYMRNLQQELTRQGIEPPIDYRAYIKAIDDRHH